MPLGKEKVDKFVMLFPTKATVKMCDNRTLNYSCTGIHEKNGRVNGLDRK